MQQPFNASFLKTALKTAFQIWFLRTVLIFRYFLSSVNANRTSADTWHLLISSVLIFLFRLFQLQTSNSNPIPNLSLSNGIHQTLASIFVSLERERERESAVSESCSPIAPVVRFMVVGESPISLRVSNRTGDRRRWWIPWWNAPRATCS